MTRAKKRVELINKEIRDLRRLGAVVLCGQDTAGPLDDQSAEVINYAFRDRTAPLDAKKVELKTIATSLMQVFFRVLSCLSAMCDICTVRQNS